MDERNYVADAIEILGGPTRTAKLLEITNQSVHYLRNVGKVTNAAIALKLEWFTTAAGRTITAWQLSGEQPPVARTPTPAPSDDPNGPRGATRSAARARSYGAAPATATAEFKRAVGF